MELSGVIIVLGALATCLALVSFNPQDPSINAQTSSAASNLLGIPGAYVADILLQTIGLAAYALVVVLVCWGWRIVRHWGMGQLWLYATMLPPCLVATSMFAATINDGTGWVIASGYGGYLGYALQSRLLPPILEYGVPAWALSTALGFAVLVLFVPASGISWRQWGAMVARVVRTIYLPVRYVALGLSHSMMWIAGRAGQREDLKPVAETGTPGHPKQAKSRKATVKKTRTRVKRETPKLRKGKRSEEEKQPALKLDKGADLALPPLALLTEPNESATDNMINEAALAQNARLLESVLDDFGVKGQITEVRPGPVVTLYELEPAPGTKSSRVIGLSDDIARSMSAISARVAVVPGRNAIGIELPNTEREMVTLRELLASRNFERSAARLALALGKDIGGASVIADLASMPHLLIAGTTGSGKSVAVNTMILSLIFRLTPDQCRFIMIDPKMLELSVYDGIPHLLAPVVTDPRKAVVALKWAVREMEDRYKAMSILGVRNLAAYNERLAEAANKGEQISRTVQTGFDAETGEPVYEEQALDLTPMPLIVVVVDEMADLMMVAGKDVEGSIQRLAQMARAAGIHLIMATQRPSVDVITGTIKANFPTRISFQVTSKIDSRTILGEQGAEQLLGQGDMLYLAGGGRLTRVHGPFVSDEEVEAVVKFLKAQGTPE